MIKYPWPASALSREDMHVLHQVRERSPERLTITELVARAVRTVYCPAPTPATPATQPTKETP